MNRDRTEPGWNSANRGGPRRRSPWPWVGGLLALLVIAVGLVLYFGIWYGAGLNGATQANGEIFLEPNGDPGSDPFAGDQFAGAGPTTSLSIPNPSETLPASEQAGAVRSYSGDTPALYGGSKSKTAIDKEAQLRFFEQNPDKAAAFCEALNSDPNLRWSGGTKVQPSQLRAYFAELTALMLTHDCRVTNHGYRNGHPTPRQSVLQAGQFVLVDRYCVPRVRVQCGNPLIPPKEVRQTPTYSGKKWQSFNPTTIIVIQPTTVIINTFTVIDVDTGKTFGRPAGTGGGSDGPAPPLSTTTTTPPSNETTTSATAETIPGNQLTGSWSGTLTITDMNLDQQAAGEATQLGIPVQLLRLAKGLPLPFTMQITMDSSGKTGTATAQIKIGFLGNTGAVGSPITLPFTFDGETITFDVSQANQQGQTTNMLGMVSQPGQKTLKIAGHVESSGNGTSLKADWQVTK